ncbi:hypothetical protein GGR54DRAFT_635761 [Hypoxylon sp. NC1633]|nr:hypothetical protein GGR54DRAFT_635761 [Hypoxylon sp. NC1633]
MSSLVRWISSVLVPRRYQPLEDLKTQVDEQTQEQSPMFRTLCMLQRTMDPLLAAQVYNVNYSPLCRLPDELLLLILGYLEVNDPVARYCISHVSKRLRRLVVEYDWWQPWQLPLDLQQQLRQRLQKCRACDKCRLWRDYYDIFSSERMDRVKPLRCKFQPFSESSELYRPHYCRRCHTDHDIAQHIDVGSQVQCKGRRGSVQLCEHVRIYWITIECHIVKWQRRKPGDWQACFDNFNIECHHRSHDMRCTTESSPTWPRALLRSGMDDRVVLTFEWAPHSGLDSFTFTPDGRMPASELRAVFQKYRQGLASMLLPSHLSTYLPEMACFHHDCTCIHYETGGDETQQRTTERLPCQLTSHNIARLGQIVQRVDMSKHCPRDPDSACLITTYQLEIPFCRKTDRRGTINPTHEWLHAMDPDTYPHLKDNCTKPLCKDKDCINYYRVRRPLSHFSDPQLLCSST